MSSVQVESEKDLELIYMLSEASDFDLSEHDSLDNFVSEETDYIRYRGREGLEIIRKAFEKYEELVNSDEKVDEIHVSMIENYYQEVCRTACSKLTPANRAVSNSQFSVSNSAYGAVMGYLEDIDLAQNRFSDSSRRRMTGKVEDYWMIGRLLDSVPREKLEQN
ncbi:MAG: hypothetical protein ABEJ56_00840 [Candidatus Nanohaloarchaea archaeon]